MATQLNRVTLYGNLVRDPEIKYTQGGIAVCNFVLANNRKYKEVEKVSFIKITCWGKIGELCNEYLAKGSSCIVDGRLEQETWEDDQGKRREKTGIVAENVQFVNKPKDQVGTQEKSYQPAGDEEQPPF